MELTVHNRSRLIVVAAVVAVAVVSLTFVRPTGGAIPASAVVGKVTYTKIDGTTNLTAKIRSFTTKAEQPGALNGGTGGGQGKVSFGAPRVVHEVVASTPDIMLAVATGRHLPTVVVTLYHPKSTKKSQVWTFTDAFLTLDEQTQKGPASAIPSETVSWAYDKVSRVTYKANGTTVASTFCFDVKMNANC